MKRTMKRLSTTLAALLATMVLSTPALAVPMITLDPNPAKIHGLEDISVDINVSGLDTLLGAWDLQVLYDPAVFLPLLGPPTGFGDRLGDPDPFAFETITGIDTSTPGVIDLFQISLLFSTELDDLQGDPPGSGDVLDSFTLATVGLRRFDLSTGKPETVLSTANIILSDDLGNRITPVLNPSVTVAVPQPGTLLLIVIGLLGFVSGRRRQNLVVPQRF